MTSHGSKRLTRDAWLEAGLKVLRDRGADALKAEPMARHMGTTKGSFYWHFKDVADFHAGLLALWETAAQSSMNQIFETDAGDVSRLRALAQSFSVPDAEDPALLAEQSIRSWSSGHHGAAEVVARVDSTRLTKLAQLLRSAGVSNPEMAQIVYAAGIGMAGMSNSGIADNHITMGSLVDLVLALR